MDKDERYYNSYNDNPQPPYGQMPQGTAPVSAPQPAPPKKPKSRMGIGILIGVLITLAAVMLAAVVLGFFVFLRPNSLTTNLDYDQKLELIRNYLDQYYLGDLDEEALENGLAEGLLKGTGDKYAEYYTPAQFSMMMEERAGSYCGIGVSVVQNDDNMIEVYRVFDGSPAEEAGIQIADLIVEADGVRDFETLDSLVEKIRGEKGTTVSLVILRNGEEIPMTVERRSIDMTTVYYEMLEGQIGYIQLIEFDEVSVKQFNDAIDALEAEGMTSLIIDVRDNPGGDYGTVMQITDRVLPAGAITTVIDKKGTKKVESSDEENKLTLPMVVLINNNSASATELFSGALKDYGVATLVGETTYGKGVIQSIFQLPDGSGMKFTTEEYLTPDGDHINGIGISPDVEVSLPEEVFADGIVTAEEDTQLQAAIRILSGEGTARAAD